MIIGLITLISMLFGVSSVDTFYIDKIDSSVSKFIDDKDRLKEIKAHSKAYSKVIKSYNKEESTAIKSLKKTNLDKSIAVAWYEDFFESRMKARKELQERFMMERLYLQETLKDNEWAQCMAVASEDVKKDKEKESKAKDKEIGKIDDVLQLIEKEISEEKKQLLLKNALQGYNESFNTLADAYEDQNVNNSAVMNNKGATKEDLEKINNMLNEQRLRVFEAYVNFIKALKENTGQDQYAVVVKAFNKSLD